MPALYFRSRDGSAKHASLAYNMNPRHWAFLACPGPSLADYDTSMLVGPGRTVVAMNTAYPHIRPDIWFGLDDPRCFHPDLVLESFPKIFSSGWISHESLAIGTPNTYFARMEGKEKDIPMNLDPDNDDLYYYTGSSFCSAIHFILKMGIRNIALFGCDMSNDQADYVHGNTLDDNHRELNSILYDKLTAWLRLFNRSRNQINVRLVNLCKTSRLASFIETMDFQELMSQVHRPCGAVELKHCGQVRKERGHNMPKMSLEEILGQ